MASIRNDRDVLLQAATVRLEVVTAPPNFSLPPGQLGPGQLPGNVSVVPETNFTYVPVGILTGTIQANQISATIARVSQLDAITITADRIEGGSFSGETFTGGTFSGSYFTGGSIDIGNNFSVSTAGVVRIDDGFIYGARLWSTVRTNQVFGTQTQRWSSLEVGALGTHGNSHALRAQQETRGTSGLVGAQNGYAFYAEAGQANYGPFTGAHDAVIDTSAAFELGDIVVDVRCLEKRDMSNTLFEVELSREAHQRAALGVVALDNGPLEDHAPAAMIGAIARLPTSEVDVEVCHLMTGSYYDCCQSHRLIAVNALGEGLINVCGQGGNIEAGDLIVCSDMPGKGMKQVDDVVRSYTVAKAREAVTFSSPGEVKLVPCIYLCG